MTNFAKTPKSAIFWNSSKGGPRENGWKSRPTLGAPKSPRRKSGYPLISIRLKSNLRRAIWCKPRLQKCPQVRVMTNLAKTPKSAIFWNSLKGGPRENGWKSRPTLGAPKSPRRKSGYPLISIRLKSNSSESNLVQTAPPKGPASPSYDKFSKNTKIGHFLKFFKGGTKGKWLKK